MKPEYLVVTIHDRVASLDSSIRFSLTAAHAIRDFKQAVNMPSESMLFHAPGDFELVRIGAVYRSEDGTLVSAELPREVLVTGTAAVDLTQRERYAQLAQMVNNKEPAHAPQ